jgi:hypothetical protein
MVAADARSIAATGAIRRMSRQPFRDDVRYPMPVPGIEMVL